MSHIVPGELPSSGRADVAAVVASIDVFAYHQKTFGHLEREPSRAAFEEYLISVVALLKRDLHDFCGRVPLAWSSRTTCYSPNDKEGTFEYFESGPLRHGLVLLERIEDVNNLSAGAKRGEHNRKSNFKRTYLGSILVLNRSGQLYHLDVRGEFKLSGLAKWSVIESAQISPSEAAEKLLWASRYVDQVPQKVKTANLTDDPEPYRDLGHMIWRELKDHFARKLVKTSAYAKKLSTIIEALDQSATATHSS